MGSVENQNPWGPYENYRDCSQEICSIYCPQFCYLIFPPPPPLDEDSGTPFSPLVIAVIGVLASAFLLVSYYTIVTRFCWRRRRNGPSPRTDNREGEVAETGRDQWPAVSAGLDESVIKTITVCKYEKGDGLIEGTDCAVCLSEFQENESLRLLPNCSHAFHPPCIDTWLKSQSSCPLCRANVVAFGNQTHPPPAAPPTPSTLNVNSFEFRRPDDLIHVVDDRARACQQGIAIGAGTDDPNRNDVNGADQVRNSVCLGAFSPQRRLLISDVLAFEEIDEYVQGESDHLWRGIGSSKGSSLEESNRSRWNRNRECGILLQSPVSDSRFMLPIHDKGKQSLEYR